MMTAKAPNESHDQLTSARRALRDVARTMMIDARAGKQGKPDKQALAGLLDTRLVRASWTLRRLPDRERGFLQLRGSMWPEIAADGGTYAAPGMTSYQARRQVRLSAGEIDQMQPTLDLLQLLPDREDRKIAFYAAWHQDGEPGGRVPWAKVRRSTGLALSRWTFKRRYEGALLWLAALIALQM
ncbi:hypothetical protein [Kordiimonas sp.]|uniref:hypothetical protein n=1 Tax=Kordiimonas sp. TaxID=1970157 RepID=UPI003A94939D